MKKSCIFICLISVLLFFACKKNLPSANPYEPVSPWGITYDDENLWVTDDSLSVIYKLDLELNLEDSFAIFRENIKGITSHNDDLWVVSDSAVNDSIFHIYKINKSNGNIIDSISISHVIGGSKKNNFLWGIVSFNSYLYVSYNGGRGTCMYEIDPQSKEIIRALCCAHPMGMTVISDTLWCVRSLGDSTGYYLDPIIISINGSDAIQNLSYELEFPATDLAFDGEDLWIVDRDSCVIRKINDLR